MSEAKPHILVVDDDDRLRALLKKFLSGQGFMVTAAANAAEARRKLSWFIFDAMVLDMMMPGETGLSLLESLAREKNLPVLMLSAMGEAKDRIKGLAAGAEDYLAKPFEPEELVLRIRNVISREPKAAPPAAEISFGEFVFDIAANRLMRGGQPVALTSGESALIRQLARSLGRPVSREDLAKSMPAGGGGRSVDAHITRLRKKLGEPEGKPLYLQTVRGKGYALYGN